MSFHITTKDTGNITIYYWTHVISRMLQHATYNTIVRRANAKWKDRMTTQLFETTFQAALKHAASTNNNNQVQWNIQ